MDYPSTTLSLDVMPNHLHEQIEHFASGVSRLSFVGFSMGGLVSRAYIHAHRPVNLGRVVLIGTPNNGSEVADLLKNFALYRRFLGAAGQQLITDQSLFRHIFGECRYDIGVIAGRNLLNPIATRIFKGPNDGKVSVASTIIDGCADHIVLRRNHTLLPISRSTWKETGHFLKHGRFTTDASRMLPSDAHVLSLRGSR